MDIARKVTIRRWERGEGGIADWVYVPTFVELEIDIDGLLQLAGYKSLNNKSGKTRVLGGLIKAKAKRVEGP